jgi:hypothetical protein
MKFYSFSVLNCLELNPFKTQKLKTCLPPELAEHSHFKRFISSLNELYLKESRHSSDESTDVDERGTVSPDAESDSKLRAWRNVIRICFKPSPEMAQPRVPSPYRHSSFSFSSSFKTLPVTNNSHLEVIKVLSRLSHSLNSSWLWTTP